MNFVFTGTGYLNGVHVKRDLLVDMLNSKGHSMGKAVTYGTNYLVFGDDAPSTVKRRKAESLGITEIPYSEFFDLMKNGSV